MNSKSRKRLIIVVLILFNVLAIVKIAGNTEAQVAEDNELKNALETARNYKEKNLNVAALEFYQKALEKTDTVEVRKEMIQAYKGALKNGEISEQAIIDDFVLASVDQLWKQEGIYEIALDYFDKANEAEQMVEVIQRAMTNNISSNKIKKSYEKLSHAYTKLDVFFQDVKYSNGEQYCVSDGNQYGYVDAFGNIIRGYMYDFASPYYDGYAVVKSGEFVYLTDENGTRWKYLDKDTQSSCGIEDGVVVICKGEKSSWIKLDGTYTSKQFDYVGKFSQNMSAINEGGDWYIVNSDGEKISSKYCDVKMNNLQECVTNGVIFAKESSWHMFNTKMEKMSSFDFDDVDVCYGGEYFAFKKNGKWGFADYKGNILIQPQYQEAKAFCNGYAGVKKDGKWGFINTQNQFQMSGDYQDVLYFTKDKTCFVKENDLWTIIKKLI